MNKTPYIILFLLFLACFCNNHDKDKEEQKEEEVKEEIKAPEPQESQTTADFVPKSGMALQFFAGMPDVTWDFDTIHGLCAPDTLMLWLRYNGIEYPTNVYGVNGKYDALSVSGEKKINKDGKKASFSKADFSPKSKILPSYGLSRSEYSALRDTLHKYESKRLEDVVKKFFLTKGDLSYMSKPMAHNWRLIYSQAEDPSAVTTNPFNRSPKFAFDPATLRVTLVDPPRGIVEVAALCTDPYTVGGRGWAYWTVKTCREDGAFKIKENPAQHRKFTY